MSGVADLAKDAFVAENAQGMADYEFCDRTVNF